ncbi:MULTISPECIES: histidinol-phosphatase [unclassified Roseovarius]|uniref:histidinol-phosphatase n=1 Tax=unclassified Roseovarius TaxID=2614913 RepID=UPI00273DE787|nr:histidinol-phosphatase [Roseovarius sp. MMSF_3350]
MAFRSSNIVNTAHALADAAGRAILPLFRGDRIGVENKAGSQDAYDPVTLADKAAEQAMRGVLADLRPDDGILGEEFGTQPGSSGLTWVLDPIDGTRAFVAGAPTWGVLIAVSDETGPIYGLIDQPYIGERFEGGFGRAIMTGPRGERLLKTRGNRALADATLLTTFPEVGTEAEGAAFRAVSNQVRLTRYGLDCYAYALVASGQVDLVIEAGLNAYDIQAPIAVIEAAGGFVTDWTGDPAHDGGRVVAAAGRQQHEAALEILARSV